MNRNNEFTTGAGTAGTAAVAALVASAALWGLSWYPYRLLAIEGMGGLWALLITQGVATLLCIAVFGRQLLNLRWSPALLVIAVLAGVTNTGFILGTLQGEVMRVTLLLYLAPLWTVFLSRWFLNERINAAGVGVVALALAGAIVMMAPLELLAGSRSGDGFGLSTADGLGLAAGLTYAGYNVSVRRADDLSLAHKTFAASFGSAWVAALALPLSASGLSSWSSGATLANPALWLLVCVTGGLLVLLAVLMQYALMRIQATRAIVIMVSELVFATASAWWLAGEHPGLREWIGGALITSAALLSSRLETGDGSAAQKITT